MYHLFLFIITMYYFYVMVLSFLPLVDKDFVKAKKNKTFNATEMMTNCVPVTIEKESLCYRYELKEMEYDCTKQVEAEECYDVMYKVEKICNKQVDMDISNYNRTILTSEDGCREVDNEIEDSKCDESVFANSTFVFSMPSEWENNRILKIEKEDNDIISEILQDIVIIISEALEDIKTEYLEESIEKNKKLKNFIEEIKNSDKKINCWKFFLNSDLSICRKIAVSRAQYNCNEETEQQVCKDVSRTVEKVCYDTIMGEEYDCSTFAYKIVCDFDVKITTSTLSPPINKNSEVSYMSDFKGEYPALETIFSDKRCATAARKLFRTYKSKISGGRYPNAPRASFAEYVGSCYDLDCNIPVHEPVCIKVPYKVSKICKRETYQSAYPCKAEVIETECNTHLVKKQKVCYMNKPIFSDVPCTEIMDSNCVIIHHISSKNFSENFNASSNIINKKKNTVGPSTIKKNSSIPHIHLSDYFPHLSEAYKIKLPYVKKQCNKIKAENKKLCYKDMPLTQLYPCVKAEVRRECKIVYKDVIEKCTRELLLPEPYSCKKVSTVEDCASNFIINPLPLVTLPAKHLQSSKILHPVK